VSGTFGSFGNPNPVGFTATQRYFLTDGFSRCLERGGRIDNVCGNKCLFLDFFDPIRFHRLISPRAIKIVFQLCLIHYSTKVQSRLRFVRPRAFRGFRLGCLLQVPRYISAGRGADSYGVARNGFQRAQNGSEAGQGKSMSRSAPTITSNLAKMPARDKALPLGAHPEA